jgi:transposase-like protein
VRSSGRTVTDVARELGISSESLRGWVKKARAAQDSGTAPAESFWAVLKEEIGTRFWPDRATARADIFDFVETFYNRRRLRKTSTGATSHPTRHACAISRARPSRHDNTVSKITGKTSSPR